MLIPAKALNYGGPRSTISCQLPTGKILPALAATPINTPNVAVGFDQNGQAWVWGEVSKIELQSTSIRKNRPSPNQEPLYPFKAIAQWGNLGYIAQAGDRSSQQVEAQKILAFGNRGKKKNDFILLTEIGTNQYRLKNREGERNLNFSSPEILEAFKANSRFYGDDYYGFLLRDEQDWRNSDVITVQTGDSINGTTTQSTPNGGFNRVQTRARTGSASWNPPTNTLYSPPSGGLGITYTQIDLIPLPPDPLIISGLTGDYSATPQDRANWQASIDACVAGLVNVEPPPAITKGGESFKDYNQSWITNTQSRKRLLSGFLDSISKTTAINQINETNSDLIDGQLTVTPNTELIVPSSGSGGYCSALISWLSFRGAYYTFVYPYNAVFDQTSSNTLTTDNDTFADSYNNSIPININNFNTINYTVNSVYNSNYTSNDTFSESALEGSLDSASSYYLAGYTSYEKTTETTDTRNLVDEITNSVTGLYKGSDELCLYSKIDNTKDNLIGSRIALRREGFNDFTNTTTTINGQTESNTDIIVPDIYLANKETNIGLGRDYFYIRVIGIKNKINLSQLTTPFNFNITQADIQERIGRFLLYFGYPVKFSIQSVTKNILSNPPQNITISNSATPITFYNDEYYLSPNTSYPIELIVFESDIIYKLSGTATINYQNTTETFTANNSFFPGNYGQLSYTESSLDTVSITIENSALIKYHALKGVNPATFGHLYSSANCLGLFQKLLGTNFNLQSGIRRTTLYKRKNNQIMIAFSDNSNLTQRGDRYADLYRLQGNKFIREGEKKGTYYPVINPNSNSNPSTSIIGYHD